jgi:ABC-type phosphate transport system substrate-binding protein
MKLRRRSAATAVAMSAALAGTVAAAVLLTACTGSSAPSSQERASALCAKAAGTGHVVASFATTVGEVRAWKVGPAQHPAAAAWGGYSAGDFAAWCWLATSASGSSGNVVAISGGKPAITFATGDFAAMLPSANGPAVS